jgi:formylglycine-generating enzyme required for sulfatase activity
VGTTGEVAYSEKGVDYKKDGFCYKLSHLVDATDTKHFRLPTEAEWEYAASGGHTATTIYSGSNDYNEVAWAYDNMGDYYGAQPVGTKAANELGIYDMSGNVREWCSNWWGGDYPDTTDNPTGPTTPGSDRVYRGGSWHDDTVEIRVYDRQYGSPDYRYGLLGFRVVLDF